MTTGDSAAPRGLAQVENSDPDEAAFERSKRALVAQLFWSLPAAERAPLLDLARRRLVVSA